MFKLVNKFFWLFILIGVNIFIELLLLIFLWCERFSLEFSKLNSDNPYTVDTSIGYQLQNSDGISLARTQSYGNSNDIILNLELPPKLITLNIGDSIDFTIINQGTHSLLLNDTTDYKVIGFQMIYDVTSAQFKVHKVSENNYNVYRMT